MTNPSIEMLKAVVDRLGKLADELVFVGGCTTSLFISEPGTEYVRPTKDVDAIVEVTTYTQYTDFEVRLQAAGFVKDMSEGAPLCRWLKQGIILDVMPMDGDFWGFKSAWYPAAVRSAEIRELSAECSIRVVTPACFLATKIEAYHGRGNGDYLASQDIEDVVTVINGREEIVKEVSEAASDVRKFIVDSFSRLRKDRRFLDSLPGHLNPDTGRVGLVIERLGNIAEVG